MTEHVCDFSFAVRDACDEGGRVLGWFCKDSQTGECGKWKDNRPLPSRTKDILPGEPLVPWAEAKGN